MKSAFFRNNFVWGFLIWLFGYLASFVLFFIIPASLIGWTLMPFGIIITVWVLLRKIVAIKLIQYFTIGVIWLFLAVTLDYLFIVKALHPADGYYKPSVYMYYVLTLTLPVITGTYKTNRSDIIS